MTAGMASKYLAMFEAADMRRGYCEIPRCDACGRSNADVARVIVIGGLFQTRSGRIECVLCKDEPAGGKKAA